MSERIIEYRGVDLFHNEEFDDEAFRLCDEIAESTDYPSSRFQDWLKHKTGISTTYPTDFANLFARKLGGTWEFSIALYGVAVLSVNARWESKQNDRKAECPKKPCKPLKWNGMFLPYDDEYTREAGKLWWAEKVSQWTPYDSRASRIWKDDEGYRARERFMDWIRSKTGIHTYFPTDFAIYFGHHMDKSDFIDALYGVSTLALNCQWLSEVTDIEDDAYTDEERNKVKEWAKQDLIKKAR